MTTEQETPLALGGATVPCLNSLHQDMESLEVKCSLCGKVGDAGRVYFFPSTVRPDQCPQHDVDTEDFRCAWCKRTTDWGWAPATDGWTWIEAAMKVGWHIRHLFQSSANTWECILTYKGNTQMPPICVVGTAKAAFFAALLQAVEKVPGVEI